MRYRHLMETAIDLVEIDDEVRSALLQLHVTPEQERYVGGQIDEVMPTPRSFQKRHHGSGRCW